MKKSCALLLVLAMLMTMLAACGSSSSTTTSSTTETSSSTESTAAAAEETTEAAASTDTAEAASTDSAAATETLSPTEVYEAEVPDEDYVAPAANLPLSESGATLSLFVELPGYMSMFGVNSYSDIESCQYAAEITGVTIDYTIVNSESYSTNFTLMVASGMCTDMIANGSDQYSSTAQMIEDGVAIDLMDYEDLLPNYFLALSYYPEYKTQAINQDGQMVEVITIADDYMVSTGLQIREDWLNQLGMDVPTTVDELYECLVAFKTEFGADHALLLSGSTQITGSSIVGAFGTVGFDGSDTTENMFVVDGVIQNGFLADGYKDYLEMIAQWYAEGLIATDFATESNDPFTSNADAYIQGGNAGVWSSQSDNMDSNMSSGQSLDPNYSIVAVPQPVLEEGEIFHFGADSVGTNSQGKKISISENCEDIELACAYLDFWYSAEGQVLANYGLEGVSFEYNAEGVPEFTDVVLNNPEFPMVSFATTYYTPSCVATLQDYDRVFGAYSEANLAAMALWTATEDSLYTLPSGVELTYEESTAYSEKWSDIATYASTEVFKFVMGDYNFDSDWDNFINTLMSMGLQDCIDLYQAAYDRYCAAYGL